MTTGNNIKKLAIIIPAYKARFLREALESFAGQTDKRFTVYVGDDASPEDLKGICDDYRNRFDLVYTRFAENLGHKSLVAQWNRCIEKSSEPWIWLFCDDDVMEPECVEKFYNTIERKADNFDLFRFNTLTIDDDGKVIRINPPHPWLESGIQFIYHRLRGERLSYVSEYIFSREAYKKNGGMVDFPIAWCSDDASWLAFSGQRGILTIKGAYVFWRRGAYNITPSGAKYQTMRVEAAFRFVRWLDEFLKENKIDNKYLTKDTIKNMSTTWFLNQVRGVAPISFSNYSKFANFIHIINGVNLGVAYYLLVRINIIFLLKKLKF